MGDMYKPVENRLIKPVIAFAGSINVDGGVVSDIAVLGNEKYQLIVRPEGIFARMPCNYDDNGDYIKTSIRREYNIGALIEAIQEINRRTAWMETDMDLSASLKGTDVLKDEQGNDIDNPGPSYDHIGDDLLPALKDPLVYSVVLVDNDDRVLDFPLEYYGPVRMIVESMIEEDAQSRILTPQEIESIFFMASNLNVNRENATISPQTALLIPRVTLVNGNQLRIKIWIDDNYGGSNTDFHIYQDDYYVYTYYELGNKSINETLVRELNDPIIAITIKDDVSDPGYEPILEPYILTLNSDIENETFIYQMINVCDAVYGCRIYIDQEPYDKLHNKYSDLIENAKYLLQNH